MEEFFTINEKITCEIVEKKSKFIANLVHVESKEQAEEIIDKIKKKYFDARHNCIAYRVIDENQLLEKASDDGEPSGTAGAPMLDILKSNNLCNVVIIVTRYFGGILLGTGGLVRAYSDATIKSINEAEIIKKCKGIEYQVELEYNNFDIFKYYCKNNNIKITDSQYFEKIVCKIELEFSKKGKLLTDINSKELNVIDIKALCEKLIDKSVEK